MIETLALIATSIWVLIGATVVMPYMVDRKLRKRKTIEDLTIKATDAIEESMPKLVTKLFDNPTFIEKVDKFKKDQLESFPELIATAFNSEEFGSYLEGMFESGIKRMEGAIYKKMGITEEELANAIAQMVNALKSIPEGTQLDLGAAGPMIGQIMGGEEGGDQMIQMIKMAVLQKIAPQLFGGAPAQGTPAQTQGLQPPR